MRVFAELGALVEGRWRAEQYREEVFPQIAADALAETDLPNQLSSWEILHWVASAGKLPKQTDPEAEFGDPPVTVFANSKFHIDVYYWLDGTTDVHQHRFRGAFQVLHGSSVHARYDFEERHRVNPQFLTGCLTLRDVTLLSKGEVRQILAGPAFIHSLFHLDRPSVTITIRNYQAPDVPVQYSYLRPSVAHDPFSKNHLLLRKVQTANLALRAKYPDAEQLIAEIIETSDFETAFFVLKRAFDYLCHRELEELFALSRSRDRFNGLLKHATAKYGELAQLLLPVYEESWRQSDISRRRSQVQDEHHRFFLALLLNVPNRLNILKLLQERLPDVDPVEHTVGVLKTLTSTKIFGSREPNVLGINFDSDDLLVTTGLLRGLPIEEIEATSGDGRLGRTAEIAGRLKQLPILQPLFTDLVA